MSFCDRLQYYRRIFPAYLMPGPSQLSFWYECPEENVSASGAALGEYYLTYFAKADYKGPYDWAGIPLLDYRGRIGLQYNPIAVAQWGLGNYNLYRRFREKQRLEKFLFASDWLVFNLAQNSLGVDVWQHHFDWEYRNTLKAPWHSGLAQGQGISLLVRAWAETENPTYEKAARRAFDALLKPLDQGGVSFTDAAGNVWFEEYIVFPPTHILNGFISAIWGVLDYFLAARDAVSWNLFTRAVDTLLANIDEYHLGYWSLYEQSGTRFKMVASPFYHRLHIAQLRIMARLTGVSKFSEVADRWQHYRTRRSNRTRALLYKSAFKLCHY